MSVHTHLRESNTVDAREFSECHLCVFTIRSLEWTCDVCGVPNRDLLSASTYVLPPPHSLDIYICTTIVLCMHADMEDSLQRQTMEEAADIVSQMAFKVHLKAAR